MDNLLLCAATDESIKTKGPSWFRPKTSGLTHLKPSAVVLYIHLPNPKLLACKTSFQTRSQYETFPDLNRPSCINMRQETLMRRYPKSFHCPPAKSFCFVCRLSNSSIYNPNRFGVYLSKTYKKPPCTAPAVFG